MLGIVIIIILLLIGPLGLICSTMSKSNVVGLIVIASPLLLILWFGLCCILARLLLLI